VRASVRDDTKGAKAQTTLAKQKKIRLAERRFLSHYRNYTKNCFSMQNFTEIWQSDAELLQIRFLIWLSSAILNFKIFGQDCHRVRVC